MTAISIVGTGFIGRAWAIAHARAGNDVRLWDQNFAAAHDARDYIKGILLDLKSNELLNGFTVDEVMSRLHPIQDLAEALDGVSYVQESTFEDLEIKKDVYSRLDAVTPKDAVIASSTSALLPSMFTEHVTGRARCIVAHPINPPYLIPAVEIVPAPWTSPDTIKKTADTLEAIGNAPIVMRREIDGFVVNRLQGALLEECFRLVADGYAQVEDVDVSIREGLALRWSFMGPFETIDLNAPAGVRDYAERYSDMYGKIRSTALHRADWTGPALDSIENDRRKHLSADDLETRQEWRDRRLMVLLRHKAQAASDIGK